MTHQEQIAEWVQEWIITQLVDRKNVELPPLGTLSPQLHPEYILQTSSTQGTSHTLVPPHITLAFTPSAYLSQKDHYNTLQFIPPTEYFPNTIAQTIAELHDTTPEQVLQEMSQVIKALLKHLQQGKRVQLLNICELYITEEKESTLLLNIQPTTILLKALNHPFAPYHPTPLRPGITFPDLQVRTQTIQDTPLQIHLTPAPSTNTPTTTSPTITSPTITSPITSTPTTPQASKTNKSRKTKSILWLTTILITTLALIYFYPKSTPTTTPPSTDTAITTPPSTDTATTTPPSTPLDTIAIKHGDTLAKIARQYYHHTQHWVYIYIANKEKIRDPNNIEIGTTLTIMPLSYFQILPDPNEALKEAKQWESIILSGQFTSYETQRTKLQGKTEQAQTTTNDKEESKHQP